MEAQKRLTLEGYIVISVGLFGHSGDGEVWENMPENTVTRTKAMLDDMHKRKIDMADEIYVLNVNDYIGQSTKSEIAYARAHGKIVRFLEPHVDEPGQTDQDSTGGSDGNPLCGAVRNGGAPLGIREECEQFEQTRRRVQAGLRDEVERARQESSSAYACDEDGDDDYASLEAVMRQAVQGVGVAGTISPEDATAALIAYQNGACDEMDDDGVSVIGGHPEWTLHADERSVRADQTYPHTSYAVDVSEDDDAQDPAEAKAAYVLQMLHDGYDIGNTAYFIGEDEAFVRAVMAQNGITDDDLIRYQNQ